MANEPKAFDANGEEFQVGDQAIHVSQELDGREVVKIEDGNIIQIWLLTAAQPVPAENYLRYRPK